jgi:aminoglycoside 6'-N-acetyltransferase
LAVSFRPLERADFPLLVTWLALPHVAPWWSDEPTMTAVEASYGPTVDGADPTEGFIIDLEGRPVGFIQRYLLDDYPAWSVALGIERAAGIDYMIGVPELTGVGLGPIIVDSFTVMTFERYRDIDRMGVAVQQANHRSWRALEKAGYERVFEGRIESDDPSDDGPSYVYVRQR